MPLTWENKRRTSLATTIASHDSRTGGGSNDTIRTSGGGPSRSSSQQSVNFERTYQSIEQKPQAIEDLFSDMEGENLRLKDENGLLKTKIHDRLKDIEVELKRQDAVQSDIRRDIKGMKDQAVQVDQNIQQGIQSIEKRRRTDVGEVRKIQEDVKNVKRKVDAGPQSSCCCCIC